MLQKIKKQYGGSIKARAGGKALRYRQHNKRRMINLCNDVNGFLRHPVRLRQFQKVLNILGLNLQESDTLNYKNGWFAGMFDADGTVTLKENGQITLSVTQKYKEIPVFFKESLNIGNIYYDKSQNGYWSWSISSEKDVLQILEYFKHYPVLSSRRQKQFLLPKIYTLKKQKAHLSSSLSPLSKKKWIQIVEKWKSFSPVFAISFSFFFFRYREMEREEPRNIFLPEKL